MTKVFDCALRLLARREHSERELFNKLKRKGFHQDEINEALRSCQRLELQSDHRFVDLYVDSRIRQGYGPLKISQELKLKGIDAELIQSALRKDQAHWLTHALAVWKKKCHNQTDLSFDELQKQQRFLLSRGFERDIISRVMKTLNVTTRTSSRPQAKAGGGISMNRHWGRDDVLGE